MKASKETLEKELNDTKKALEEVCRSDINGRAYFIPGMELLMYSLSGYSLLAGFILQ